MSAIGIHIHKSGNQLPNQPKCKTYTESAKYAIKYITDLDLNPCIQLFVKGPMNYNYVIDKQDAQDLKMLNVPICIHGAYVDSPWGKSRAQAIGNMESEARIAKIIGATGLLIHYLGG